VISQGIAKSGEEVGHIPPPVGLRGVSECAGGWGDGLWGTELHAVIQRLTVLHLCAPEMAGEYRFALDHIW